MQRSRLKWALAGLRALAVLGALFSIMLKWQIGLAMPATTSPSIKFPSNKTSLARTHDSGNSSNRNSDITNNCSVNSLSTMNGVSALNSDIRSDPGLSGNHRQQILSTFSEENRSTSEMNLLGSIHSKRKRKKNVFRITAATLRNFKTKSYDSSDHDSNLEITTIDPLVDNATVYHYLSRTDRSTHEKNQRKRKTNNSNLDRNERSANLSHISGPARKIQLYIKNRFIQLMPDGIINGTQDDLSDYTILQRTTVDVGKIKIQGVATCLYLCMDQCGSVYGSKAFTDDCVFNESMEQHHYNTYSSTYNSNSRRTLYLALNRHGDPRKLQIPPTRPLGKLATYTKALTETVPQERVENLISKTFGANRVKHGLRQLCDAGKPLIELTAKVMNARPKCNITTNWQSGGISAEKLRLGVSITNNSNNSNSDGSSMSHNNTSTLKKKKKKRRCRHDEIENDNCHKPGPQALKKRMQKQKCNGDGDCRSRRKTNKKQQNVQGPRSNNGNKKGKKPNGPNGKKGKSGGRTTTMKSIQATTSTPLPTTTYTSQTSTEYQNAEEEIDGDDVIATSLEHEEDEDISGMTSIGGQTNLVDSGENFLYDGDLDV